MSFERALLWSLGLMLLLFGIGYLVSPVSMLALTGASASAPAEITDVRATYGGFQIGVGAFLIWSALAPPRLSSGLFSLGLAAGSVGLCRLAGVIVDGDCVNFETITERMIVATAQPDTDCRRPTQKEVDFHWRDMRRTVWENGTWQDHSTLDASLAEDDYDWEATIPCGTWTADWYI